MTGVGGETTGGLWEGWYYFFAGEKWNSQQWQQSLFLEQSELVNSKEKNQSESEADNGKEEMIREKLILDNNDNGKGEVLSSLDESEAMKHPVLKKRFKLRGRRKMPKWKMPKRKR